MIVYKLTDKNMQTKNGYQWEFGIQKETSGNGDLCGPGWLHAYEDQLLAVLHNPIHGNFKQETMRLFRADADGIINRDGQMKLGCTKLTLIEEIEIPKITIEQRVLYGILCAKKVCNNKNWNSWADQWISGKDRTEAAALAAEEAAAEAAAAEAAESAAWAVINLITIAHEACK